MLRLRLRVAAVVALGVVAAACVPPASGTTPTTTTTTTTTGGGGGSPVISAFAAPLGAQSGPAPALLTLRWQVSDPGGRPVTCRIDANGDDTDDITVTNCQVPGSRNVVMGNAGSYLARLVADNGVDPTVSATTTLTVTAPAFTQPFPITLDVVGTMPPAAMDAFTAAANRWSSAITRNLAPVTVNLAAGACLSGAPAVSGSISGARIQLSVTPIDGVGGILGQAGPCVASSTDWLPRVGDMQFDSADVSSMLANGTFGDVVLHEMGHVLGIGTLWNYGRSLLSGATSTGGSDPRFTGPRAVAEYSVLGGSANVPVEAGGGPGTADAHWRESTFRTEIMTGFISGANNPLSAMSIASLADLGYQVDLTVANPYSLPGLPALRSPSVPEPPGEMILHGPRTNA